MTCSEKNPRSPECAIPEWAQTENPRELAFYQHHLESLSKSLYGINVIARTLYHMEMSNAFEPGDHDWWNSYLRDGLLTAISQLAMDTARLWAQLNYLNPEGHGDAPVAAIVRSAP